MSSEEYKKVESMNPLVKEMKDEYIKQIFEAATIYKNFCEYLNSNENGEKDIYIISKKFLDNFKDKINYNKIIDYFDENNQEKNLTKFEKQLNKYSVSELESIIFDEIKIIGDLDEIDNNIAEGFEFVNYEFLEKLEYEIKSFNTKYIKEKNNIIIIFEDKSKLLISEQNGKFKYHAIPSPFQEIEKINSLHKTKTYYISNKNRAKSLKIK